MCLGTEEARLLRQTNKRIEEQIRLNKRGSRKEVKLLLLGSGESGKSTFMKQLRIIHDNGFRDTELISHRPYVFHNTLLAMQKVLHAMRRLELHLGDESRNAPHAALIEKLDILYTNMCILNPSPHLSACFVQAIESLWADGGVQQAYERRNEYQLSDSAGYFFANVSRFGGDNYVPSTEDMLRIRLPTTGVHEHSIRIKSVWFRIVDVGGQRTEKPKWIHCFEGVTSIIFLAALNEYDMFLDPMDGDDDYRHHERINRMKDSLALFSIICSIPALAQSSFILFLNKTDLLEEKITSRSLQTHFPAFPGPEKDARAARKFIEQMYIDQAMGFGMEGRNETGSYGQSNGSLTQRHQQVWATASIASNRTNSLVEGQKYLYTHFTCATDTENIKFIFEAVKNTILREHLREFLNIY